MAQFLPLKFSISDACLDCMCLFSFQNGPRIQHWRALSGISLRPSGQVYPIPFDPEGCHPVVLRFLKTCKSFTSSGNDFQCSVWAAVSVDQVQKTTAMINMNKVIHKDRTIECSLFLLYSDDPIHGLFTGNLRLPDFYLSSQGHIYARGKYTAACAVVNQLFNKLFWKNTTFILFFSNS